MTVQGVPQARGAAYAKALRWFVCLNIGLEG